MLTVHLITPERIVYADKADSVVLPAAGGEMEVLPQHTAIFALIVPGQLTVKLSGARDHVYAVGAGICEVALDNVSILVDSARGESEINIEAARALLANAQDRLADIPPENAEERFAFETQLATAKARIEVYKKVHKSEGSVDTQSEE